MNVKAEFSSVQFPTYTATGKSSVIKQRRPVTDEPGKIASAKKPQAEDPVTGAALDAQADTVISDAEKQFFENLFPASAGEIRSYSPYGRNGMKQSVTLGSLVDLKG
jgi:hypothetical protein